MKPSLISEIAIFFMQHCIFFVTGNNSKHFSHNISELCPAGSYSPSGLNHPSQPCRTCERGSYQTRPGQLDCKICYRNYTTLNRGATSPSFCKGLLYRSNFLLSALHSSLSPVSFQTQISSYLWPVAHSDFQQIFRHPFSTHSRTFRNTPEHSGYEKISNAFLAKIMLIPESSIIKNQ